MPKHSLTYKSFGNSALLIEWKSEMDEAILSDLLAFQHKINSIRKSGVIEIIQSIHSLTILYNNKLIQFEELKNWLENLHSENCNFAQAQASTPKFSKLTPPYFLWQIPVCYHEQFGSDLQEIASFRNLTTPQIIEIHSNTIYQVYSIGFLPGFLYLGGLSEKLHIDRKANPRLKIAKGSVGIGGKQTGIYPNESPGGWQIIGNSPIHFFDITENPPCFAKAGDKIQFIPISLEEHSSISKLVSQNAYQLKKEALNA
jgi:inhibitor of KinA